MTARLCIVVAGVLAAPLAGAQTFEFDTPTDDRWYYPFNFTAGTRDTSSIFGATGVPGFNDRDGVQIVAWDTSAQITAGLDPNSYDVDRIRVVVTNEGSTGPTWPIDLTVDEWFTFDVNGDGEVNADGVARGEPGDTDGESDDDDPGRPIELFGVGFGPFYTPEDWNETSFYIGAEGVGEVARDPFPLVYQDGTGTILHVEDHVDGFWNEDAGVFSFTPQPWALGEPVGYDPNSTFEPFDIEFEVDLDLSDGLVRRYFQEQLSAGRLFVTVTSLFDTVQDGDPAGFPRVFNKDAVGSIDGAKAPLLVVEIGAGLDGDLDGDGCVSLSDLSTLLSNYGTADVDPEDGDVDGDGDVDLTDLSLLLANYGSGTC